MSSLQGDILICHPCRVIFWSVSLCDNMICQARRSWQIILITGDGWQIILSHINVNIWLEEFCIKYDICDYFYNNRSSGSLKMFIYIYHTTKHTRRWFNITSNVNKEKRCLYCIIFIVLISVGYFLRVLKQHADACIFWKKKAKLK